jgi:hypothetical protein
MRKMMKTLAAALATALTACGGSEPVAGNGTSDGGTMDDAGMVATESAADANGTSNPDASISQMTPDSGNGLPESDAADGSPDAGDGEVGIACTAATVASDCPPKPCPLALSGCVDGLCQYQKVAVCPARSFTGSFASGGVDKQIGTTLLIGNIGGLFAGYGSTCKSTTCITGGITP